MQVALGCGSRGSGNTEHSVSMAAVSRYVWPCMRANLCRPAVYENSCRVLSGSAFHRIGPIGGACEGEKVSKIFVYVLRDLKAPRYIDI